MDRFFSGLSRAEYRSEVAAYYQKRLTKYQDKLFTFLGRDGVPWNNNNGENAIKRFTAKTEAALRGSRAQRLAGRGG